MRTPVPTALVFTYRSFPGLTAAARNLGLPDVLLDIPHWGFVPVGGFDVRGGPPGHLPGVLDPHSALLFALDRWLVNNFLLPTPWGALLRPDARDTFRHGFDEQATVDSVRAELEAAGYVVLDWGSARAEIQPRRPPERSAELLAAARAVADAPDPAALRVPDLPPKVDLQGPDDDEAIRVLARAGQLWRMRWFWNTAFDGDPDDAFRVEALAREGGASDYDWARFVALAPCDHPHPPLELWVLSRVRDLDAWLTQACAAHQADLPWIAERLHARLRGGGSCIDPLAPLRQRCLDRTRKLFKRSVPPPAVDAHVPRGAPELALLSEDASYAQRHLLLLLATPGHEAAARTHLASALPSSRGGAMAGLIAVVRLAVDDPALPAHAPDLAEGLTRLGWSAPTGASVRDLQRLIRGRLAELDKSLALAAATHRDALRAGVHGTPRWDTRLPSTPQRTRDVPAVLGALLRGELDVSDRYRIGDLKLTSGRITATDPLTSLERPAYTREVSPGDYPVEVAIDNDDDIGALIVRFDGSLAGREVARWELAVRPGEDLRALAAEYIFGFPVDGGIAGVMDVEAADALAEVEEVYEDLIEPVIDETPAALLRIPDADANAAITRSGEGDGFYAAWWGLDADDRPIALVLDFACFAEPVSDAARDQATLSALAPWIDRARTVLDDAFGPHGFGPAAAAVDRAIDEVVVTARRGALSVQIAADFVDDELAPSTVCTLRGFVDDEETEADLPPSPSLGEGPYATLATIDARLQTGADAFVAALDPA